MSMNKEQDGYTKPCTQANILPILRKLIRYVQSADRNLVKSDRRNDELPSEAMDIGQTW